MPRGRDPSQEGCLCDRVMGIVGTDLKVCPLDPDRFENLSLQFGVRK